MALSWTHGRFYWNELMTHNVEGARKFYADTLGWSYDAMPMPTGTYWVVMVDGQPAGGLFEMKGPDFKGMPEHWMAFIAVDDVDARVKKAAAAGAKVMREPFDIPNVGRIAVLREPGGATIGWMTPAS
jgi:hypothetical protein